MSTLIYPSAHACELAFYRAFGAGDLAAMMAVWAEEDDIVCVHPGGLRLTGIEAVRESWRRIFAAGPGLRIQPSRLRVTSTLQTAIHTLYENLSVPGQSHTSAPIIATNVYLRTRNGWRLQLHHASAAPDHPPAHEAADEGQPPLLH